MVSESGSNDCPSGRCELVLQSGERFRDTFRAIPDEGFYFVEWKKAQGFLCGGSTADCVLEVSEENSQRDVTVQLEPVFASQVGSPAPLVPGPGDQSFAQAWTPSSTADCDTSSNASPVLAVRTSTLAEAAILRSVYEPAIVFSDESFTAMLYRDTPAESLTQAEAYPDYQAFMATDNEAELRFYDDASHGDLVAGDGVFTRSCVAVREEFRPEVDGVAVDYDLFHLHPSLRGGVSANRINEAVRMNDAGIFVSLGDRYSEAMGAGRHWEIFNPGYNPRP